MRTFAIIFVLLFAAPAVAQCENGTCKVQERPIVQAMTTPVKAAVRVVTAPVRYVHTQQPVRTYFYNRQPVRRVLRGLNAIRPVNIIRRARGCY